ncbi:hypothetical protein PINS_up001146 [Pythium insidiosum]|nr:hypothetical protein PINS_up001146 [Pythium insidiosum]
MVTTANDVGPTNTTEEVFTSLMLFVGIVINASIIGSAANLLANLDKVAIARKNQMDSINDYMRFKKVPLALQDKIRRYYEYALSTRIVDPTQTLFADLPDRLKLSLRLTLHDAFIRKVPLFRVCSNAGVIAIVQCLHPVVAMPQEIIIGQGEIVRFAVIDIVKLLVGLTITRFVRQVSSISSRTDESHCVYEPALKFHSVTWARARSSVRRLC